MKTIKNVGDYKITKVGDWYQVWHKDYSVLRLSSLSLSECEHYINAQKFII